MHDGVSFEKAGIPSAVFATTEFANAARAQADALGLPDFEVIHVEHPIQPLTQEEIPVWIANFVLTDTAGIVEIQGTAEGEPFTLEQMNALISLGKTGIDRITQLQKQALAPG